MRVTIVFFIFTRVAASNGKLLAINPGPVCISWSSVVGEMKEVKFLPSIPGNRLALQYTKRCFVVWGSTKESVALHFPRATDNHLYGITS